jgi:hypothetical protein
MKFLTDPDECFLLVRLCRDPTRRMLRSHDDGHPSRWEPTSVSDPATSETLTDAGAWEFIADLIEDHCAIELVQLREPPGTIGYVMKVEIGRAKQQLYIKVTLNKKRTAVIGRSFHYSDE